MVTNSVTNMPMGGFQALEVPKSTKANNQFANALETQPVIIPDGTQQPEQNSPSGFNALYADDPIEKPSLTDRAYQAWGYARDAFSGFMKPASVKQRTGDSQAVVIPGEEETIPNENPPFFGTNDLPVTEGSSTFPQKPGQPVLNPYGAGQPPTQAQKFYGKYHEKPSENPDATTNPDELPPEQKAHWQSLNADGTPIPENEPYYYAPPAEEYIVDPNNPQNLPIDPATGLPIVQYSQTNPNEYHPTYNYQSAYTAGPIDPVTGLPIGSQPQQLQTLFTQVDILGTMPPIQIPGSNQPVWNQASAWQQQSPFMLPTNGQYFSPDMFAFPPLLTGDGSDQTWSQGLYGDIIGQYFGGYVPQGGASSTAGLQFAPGF